MKWELVYFFRLIFHPLSGLLQLVYPYLTYVLMRLLKYMKWWFTDVVDVNDIPKPKPMIISQSSGRRKLGNPRGNLRISVGDGVLSHTVWGYLIIFKKQTLRLTNLKNSRDCFGNQTPGLEVGGQCSHHLATETP